MVLLLGPCMSLMQISLSYVDHWDLLYMQMDAFHPPGDEWLMNGWTFVTPGAEYLAGDPARAFCPAAASSSCVEGDVPRIV